MSQLQPFIRAFRALAEASKVEATQRNHEAEAFLGARDFVNAKVPLNAALVMDSLWSALNAAATALEQQIATDLARLSQPSDHP